MQLRGAVQCLLLLQICVPSSAADSQVRSHIWSNGPGRDPLQVHGANGILEEHQYNSQYLLGTAVIDKPNPEVFGWVHGRRLRILIDTGASLSFISEKVVRQLGLPLTKERIALLTGGGNTFTLGTTGPLSVKLPRVEGFQANFHAISEVGTGQFDAVLGWDALKRKELMVRLLFDGRLCEGPAGYSSS